MELEDLIENELYMWEWSSRSTCIIQYIIMNNIKYFKVIKPIKGYYEINNIYHVTQYNTEMCREIKSLEKLKYL